MSGMSLQQYDYIYSYTYLLILPSLNIDDISYYELPSVAGRTFYHPLVLAAMQGNTACLHMLADWMQKYIHRSSCVIPCE